MSKLLLVIRDGDTGHWLRFDSPRRLLIARRIDEVVPALQSAENGVRTEGLSAAGFLSYEAAPAFDAALPGREDPYCPLMVFGLFGPPETIWNLPPPAEAYPADTRWNPEVSREEYARSIDAIREEIRRGETYQINYTFRLHARVSVDPWQIFLHLTAAHETPYAAYLEYGDLAIISTSPELFFKIRGETIESRPMKGTAARGLSSEDDRARQKELKESEKDRAENLMIVDMVRNDIGRIARGGSVRVPHLFSVEKYPTLWQMTSTVSAETSRSFTEIMAALFPPASITGAPKKRAMEIIRRLEESPRRAYTGTIGFLAPDRAQFNVAIRTLLVDRRSGEAEYGIGSGIVWQSDEAQEWAECSVKSRVLREVRPEFELLETMAWSAEHGIHLLEYHVRRLISSADYFDFRVDEEALRQSLTQSCRSAGSARLKIRLRVNRQGVCRIDVSETGEGPSGLPVVSLAKSPVDASDVFLYHKTTNRAPYDNALKEAPGCDDVILFNGRGEITESTIANIAVRIDGYLWTPPIRCGLLPGTYRSWMLDRSAVGERVITVRELLENSELYLMNSVRGMYPVTLLPDSFSSRSR